MMYWILIIAAGIVASFAIESCGWWMRWVVYSFLAGCMFLLLGFNTVAYLCWDGVSISNYWSFLISEVVLIYLWLSFAFSAQLAKNENPKMWTDLYKRIAEENDKKRH